MSRADPAASLDLFKPGDSYLARIWKILHAPIGTPEAAAHILWSRSRRWHREFWLSAAGLPDPGHVALDKWSQLSPDYRQCLLSALENMRAFLRDAGPEL